jgi:hypothetical protein
MTNDLVSKSSQSWSRYMTLKGLTEHIGAPVSMFHLYIAKEDLDNATEYLENMYSDVRDPQNVTFWVQKSENSLKIIVRNSNPDNKPTSFQTNLSDIVNYDYFTSTKKNKFRIGRGAIGDATKPKLSIPYALNLERGILNGISSPLIVQYNNQESRISLDTTKFISNKLKPIIETGSKPVPNSYTQVQLSLPRNQLSQDAVNELMEYCLNYSIFSTHIKFNFDFDGVKSTTPHDAIASSTWTNQITIWAYTFDDFRVFVENLVDQFIPVNTVLRSFRELIWLPREWKSRILGDLSEQQKRDLYDDLKSHSRPMYKLPAPYGGNKVLDETRKTALIKRMSSIYQVDESAAEYKVVRTRYVSPNRDVNFPYIFEVIAIPRKDVLNSNHIFIGSINNSVSIINRGKSLYDDRYAYIGKAEHPIWNMDGILNRWYGYNLRDAKKSWPCIIAANLLVPKVHWREQGKSTCVIEPFSDTIIETITKVMNKIPTFHGWGLERHIPSSEGEKKKTAIEYLVDFLIKRKNDVNADSSLFVKDRITQSSVWYRLRPEMVADMESGKFEPKKSWTQTRRYLTSKIDDLCSGRMLYKGKKLSPGEEIVREDLGIFAIAKGMMIYRGETNPVSIDNIQKLAEKGGMLYGLSKRKEYLIY